MKQKYTNDESFEKVITFAKSINMITLPLYKEKSGYLLNSMLIPFLFSALDLLAKEISDVESIDLAWKKGTGFSEKSRDSNVPECRDTAGMGVS